MATQARTGAFRSLGHYNYRLWSAGALVSNVGTWVQRVAQDWLVLTVLTHRAAGAVGIVMALQFAPQILLLPWTGSAADHADQRKLLITTQACSGLCAITLGLLTLTGMVHLWHVYVLAFLSGSAAAFDAPVRQTFVAEMVGEEDLSNAVALNAMSFNMANLIGPAVSGLLIAAVGIGWAFLINGASFVGVLSSLLLLDTKALHPSLRAPRAPGAFMQGLRYVRQRWDLIATLAMLFLIGAFCLNFPIFISVMAVKVFHADARGYGLLSSIMAIGTLTGSYLNARRSHPRFVTLLWSSAMLTVAFTLSAFAPGYWTFAACLALIGVSCLTFLNTTNVLAQMTVEPAMRGRVMALRLAIALGGTPIGAPCIGWISDRFGPRWSLGAGALAAFVAASICLYAYLRGAGQFDPRATRGEVEPDEALI